MRTTIALAAIASLSSTVFATYGRFPCNLRNGDGSFSADPNQCVDAVLRNPGAGDKGSLPNPTNPECVLDTLNGGYACGIAGAGCISDANCDVGTCVGGVCTGAPGAACGAADDACLGYLYCTDINGAATASQTCGALGAFCQDFGLLMNAMDGATVVALSSQTCAQSAQGEVYCGFDSAVCSLRVTTIGGDCSADPDFACGTTAAGQQLTCTGNGGTTCALAAVPSGRARARRNAGFFKRNACPASHTACAIDGRAGFECIDTRTNIEQCGACATEGGKDCSAIPGVDAVGCVAGSCEIWSCQDGFMYDAASDSCLSA